MKSKKFKIAISFSGFDRDLARSIAEVLSTHNVEVFYDEWEKGYLWGKVLTEELYEIYLNSSQYVLILYSENYRKSEWANHEKRAANLRWVQQKDKEFMLPIKIGDVEMEPIFEGISYINFEDSSVEQVCDFILHEKLGLQRTIEENSDSLFVKLSQNLYGCKNPLILTWDMLEMDRFGNYQSGADELLEKSEKEGRAVVLPEIRTEYEGFSLVLTKEFLRKRPDSANVLNSYIGIVEALINSVFSRASVAIEYEELKDGQARIKLSDHWYSTITFNQSFHIVEFESGYAGSA